MLMGVKIVDQWSWFFQFISSHYLCAFHSITVATCVIGSLRACTILACCYPCL